MSDEVDVSNDNIERDLSIARKVSASRKPEAFHTGECLFCTAQLEDPKRWCDADCRDAWEYKRRTHRNN